MRLKTSRIQRLSIIFLVNILNSMLIVFYRS
nr:MAG TPA: hypothetical protein [Caudoviricetes sp.]